MNIDYDFLDKQLQVETQIHAKIDAQLRATDALLFAPRIQNDKLSQNPMKYCSSTKAVKRK